MSLCRGFGYSCFGGFNARNRPDMNVAFIQSLGGTHQAQGCLVWKHYFHNFLINGQYLCIAAGTSRHPSVTPPSPARAPHHSTYSSDLGRSWCQRASEWPSHRRCRSRAGWRALGRRTVAPCRRQVRPPRPSPATQTPARRWNWRDWLSRTAPFCSKAPIPALAPRCSTRRLPPASPNRRMLHPRGTFYGARSTGKTSQKSPAAVIVCEISTELTARSPYT